MDIVHLIETKIIQSNQEQSSHTYEEIEQTISLDHSEGMDDNDLKRIRLVFFLKVTLYYSSLFQQMMNLFTFKMILQHFNRNYVGLAGFSSLQEDMDCPKPGRQTEVTKKGSEIGPLVVSVEDLSCNVSSLDDTQKERLLTDKEMGSE